MTDPIAEIVERGLALQEIKALVELVEKKYGKDIPKEDLAILTELIKNVRYQYGKGMKRQPYQCNSFAVTQLELAC